ncbi:MAG: substrate-binding domain-containing protein, partial [Oligoflexales bacterium]|nr:substrate-binding domain-containing protein [Oligoflexales bacterium]
DGQKVGRMQAEFITDRIKKGNLGYAGGNPKDNNAHIFHDASMEVINEKVDKGEINLIFDKYTDNWLSENAYQNLKDWMKGNPGTKIDGIIGANDGVAMGIVKALGEAGLAGKVEVVGQDGDLQVCQNIVEGTIAGTIYKSTKNLGYGAAEVAYNVAMGSSVESNGTINNGKKDVPSFFLDPVLVTRENMVDTVIMDGSQKYDDVYKNVPEKDRPKKPD